MSYYDEQMRKLLARRAGDWLLARGWPRITASLGIAFGLLSGYVCSISLLSIGVHNMAGRFALASLGGYMASALYFGFWLLQISPMPAKSLLIDGEQRIKTEVPGDSEFDDKLDESIHNALRQSGREAENVMGLLITAALLGLVFIGCHFVFHAPWYLGKLMVDGGKVRHRAAPLGNSLAFLILPIRQSWPVAVLLVMHYATVGAVLQLMIPNG